MRETDFVSSCCRIALLGFGTVGSALARRLCVPDPGPTSNLRLTHVFDRRASEKRGWLPESANVIWTGRASDLLPSLRWISIRV